MEIWRSGQDQKRTDIYKDLDEEGLNTILKESPGLYLIETWITSDVRPDNDQKWLNALIVKK